VFQGTVSLREPLLDARRGRGVELDDGPPAIVWVLAPGDKPVALELGRDLAGRGKRQPERARELADRLAGRCADLREQSDVAPAKLRVAAADERGQLG
jgi:hypothetical protein